MLSGTSHNRRSTLHSRLLQNFMLKLNFNFLDLLQDEIQKRFQISKNASKKERFSKNIISGGCAGSLSLVFVQSIDYTRTRLAVDTVNAKNGGRRQFSGMIDVYVKTIKADGVRGLYRGFGISCTCIFIYRGLYFGLFDSLKPLGGNFNQAYRFSICVVY